MIIYFSKVRKVFKERGFKVLISKIINFTYFKIFSLFKFLILLPLSIIILITVRIISISKPIRFSSLNYDRIGNIYSLYWYQKVLFNNQTQKTNRNLDYFFVESENKTLKTWKSISTKNINLLSFGVIWKNYFNLNKYFWNNKRYEIKDYSFLCNYHLTKQNYKDYENLSNNLNIDDVLKKKNNLLFFSSKDLKEGEDYLKKKGTKKFEYVCFASRDNSYLKHFNRKIDWSYHNWRNCKIDNFIPAINFLADKKLSCFRTGLKVEKKIESKSNKIYDYADSKDQSELLDIFLPSKCLFGIYAQSGISLPSEFSGRPIVYVNWPDMHFNAFNNESLVILKKYYSNKMKRYLSFREILELDYDKLAKNFNEVKNDLEIILEENTPEEIKDTVIEQYNRMKNNWNETQEEKDLQDKFWLIFEKKFAKSPSFRVGAKFLKKYSYLI